MRSVAGQHDSDSPAADQKELECVEPSLGQECSQGKFSTSFLEVPSSTDQSKTGAESATKVPECGPPSVLTAGSGLCTPSSILRQALTSCMISSS